MSKNRKELRETQREKQKLIEVFVNSECIKLKGTFLIRLKTENFSPIKFDPGKGFRHSKVRNSKSAK